MARKVLELDTPFRKNEKVITTRSLGAIPEGAAGKIKLSNGLTQWMRYWVRFTDGAMVGSIDHDDLVRPAMLADWNAAREAEVVAAEAALTASEAPAEVTSGDAGDSGDTHGIPEALLERSRAAKARLLG
jgi:hypothetical protein